MSCLQKVRPFGGVVWIALLVGVARAIEGPGGAVTGQEDLSPGGIALVGAAAVYAARTIYELVLERRGTNGNGKLEAMQQRLLDLYADHAHSEERTLAQLAESLSEVRDHALQHGMLIQTQGQQLTALAAQYSVLHGLMGQVQQAVGSCLAQQKKGG